MEIKLKNFSSAFWHETWKPSTSKQENRNVKFSFIPIITQWREFSSGEKYKFYIFAFLNSEDNSAELEDVITVFLTAELV